MAFGAAAWLGDEPDGAGASPMRAELGDPSGSVSADDPGAVPPATPARPTR
jgi:hypothetical protein